MVTNRASFKSLCCAILWSAATSLLPTAAVAQSHWLTNFGEASKISMESGKPILISFSGSDWCQPCLRLERDLFSKPEFAAFAAESLILVKADFPSRKKNVLSPEQVKHNENLAEIYNPAGSFPLVLIVDGHGQLMGKMPHPQAQTADYLAALRKIIEHHP